MANIPVEFFIAGVVAACYLAAWTIDTIKGALWERSKSAKEGAHVRALVVQQYLAKAYEREKSFSLKNSTSGSSDTRPVKARSLPL